MKNGGEQPHSALIDEVGIELDGLRRAGDQLDEAVARQFGLNRTDLRCLGILYRRGRVTAGELAEESGLTPGAITTVLDRLERGGYANRVADPADRRRVLVVSTVATREIGARLYGEVELAARRELEKRSATQLTVVRDFLQLSRKVYEDQVAAITAEAAPGASPRPEGGVMVGLVLGVGEKPDARQSSAPLAGAAAGRLEFTRGAAKARLRGRSRADRPVSSHLRGPGARDPRRRRHRDRAAAPPLPAIRLAFAVIRFRTQPGDPVVRLAARRHVETRGRLSRLAAHRPRSGRRRERRGGVAARTRRRRSGGRLRWREQHQAASSGRRAVARGHQRRRQPARLRRPAPRRRRRATDARVARVSRPPPTATSSGSPAAPAR